MRRLLFITTSLLLASTAWASDQVIEPDHPEDPLHHWEHSSCAECHVCPEPTLKNPCLVACPRHGRFQGEHGADEGPEVVIIDQLAALYEPVVFAHKLHASMGAMSGGCTNCHHYSEDSGTIPPCRECHAPQRQEVDLRMPALKGAYHRQCINCHLDWSHENACGFCHAEAAQPGEPVAHDATDIVGVPHPKIEAVPTYTYETTHEPGPIVTFHHEDHVELFGQQCVDCHQGDSCASCHDTGSQPARHLNRLTSCCSCHGQRDCAFCHSDETMPRFHHSVSTDWDLAPYHENVACTVCHGEPGNFRTPATRCVSCHIHWDVGSFDHAVTGLTLSEDHVDLDCSDCHLDMEFGVTPDCENCHDEPMLPERIPGKMKLH